MRIELRNDFHGSVVSVNMKNNVITNSQLKRVSKKLCGLSDCKCGFYGIRGLQPATYERDFDSQGMEILKYINNQFSHLR